MFRLDVDFVSLKEYNPAINPYHDSFTCSLVPQQGLSHRILCRTHQHLRIKTGGAHRTAR